MAYRDSLAHPLIATYDLQVYAIDRQTGTRLWRYEAPTTIARFALAHNRVYVLDENCQLHTLVATTGELLRVVKVDEAQQLRNGGALIADADHIYIATMRSVIAVDHAGNVGWRTKTGPATGKTKPGLGLPDNVVQPDFAGS
jgi:outer membrane protein assembly factor BamB